MTSLILVVLQLIDANIWERVERVCMHTALVGCRYLLLDIESMRNAVMTYWCLNIHVMPPISKSYQAERVLM
jgi:hypothetical protein